jgi:hypothetical protein
MTDPTARKLAAKAVEKTLRPKPEFTRTASAALRKALVATAQAMNREPKMSTEDGSGCRLFLGSRPQTVESIFAWVQVTDEGKAVVQLLHGSAGHGTPTEIPLVWDWFTYSWVSREEDPYVHVAEGALPPPMGGEAIIWKVIGEKLADLVKRGA